MFYGTKVQRSKTFAQVYVRYMSHMQTCLQRLAPPLPPDVWSWEPEGLMTALGEDVSSGCSLYPVECSVPVWLLQNAAAVTMPKVTRVATYLAYRVLGTVLSAFRAFSSNPTALRQVLTIFPTLCTEA